MDISACLDSAIARRLGPFLRSRGFAKSARNFHCRHGDVWQVVNVQASQGNNRDNGKFTINLGVYHPEVAALVGSVAQGKPKEYQCTIRTRIGDLMPGKADFWWSLNADSDPDSISAEVCSVIQTVGLRWLERGLDLRNVSADLRDQPSLVSAAACLALGNTGEAERRVMALMTERPRARDHALGWASTHGLRVMQK